MLSDTAIPTLPSRDLDETIEFYSQLGFQVHFDPAPLNPYVILRRGTIELHFFQLLEIVPAESYGGCYLRVSDVDTLFSEFSEQCLPILGIPRLGTIEGKPWGMREFYVVDPSGNLIRVGQPIS
ncbi:VOC family protein [Leptolyngbya sp. FACHB-261]|uniref:bleomycin resistance protein n=1 Tax=Leptolyngbya sp. FACHB-261 TaxID=2692806 RepID=UPI0016849B68|nr:VOC family protein [Leptolyngbya sp. FACHB-261]MBD2101942.1 VOC family protein [Leptolyngbya sp. FACHB-261]